MKALCLASILASACVAQAETCHVLLLGDSTLRTSYLPEGKSHAQKLQAALTQVYPGQKVLLESRAQDGDFIGNLLGSYRYRRDVLGAFDDLDVVIIRFGGNDLKRMSPERFGAWEGALVEALRADYPGVSIVLETGVFYDPAHSRGDPNAKADAYWARTRVLAAERKTVFVDVNEAMRLETAAGRWDLRIRNDGTLDARDDAKHQGDSKWFVNSHPNEAGVDVAVKAELEAFAKAFPVALPTDKGARAGDGRASKWPSTALPPVSRVALVLPESAGGRLRSVPVGASGALTFEVRATLAAPCPPGSTVVAELRVAGKSPRKVPLKCDSEGGPRAAMAWFNASVDAGAVLEVAPKPGVVFETLVVERLTWWP